MKKRSEFRQGHLEDAEVQQALHQLVEQMKTHGIGGEAVAGIQFIDEWRHDPGRGWHPTNVQIGSMTFGAPPKP